METLLKARTGRMVLSLAMLVVVGALFSQEFAFFVAPDPRVILEVRDDIRAYENLERWPQASGSFENQGFTPCVSGTWTDAGWCLPAGKTGSLRYVLDVPAESRALLLRLFFFRRAPEARSRLLVYREGDAEPRMTFENPYFADARLDLSAVLDGSSRRLILAFEGENSSEASDVTVQYFELRLFADPLPAIPPLLNMVFAVLALGIAVLPLSSWRRVTPIWAIFCVGFGLRYYALTQVLFFPLDWDASGYHHLARKMDLFTSTGFYSAQFGHREPLHVLIVKAVLGVLGDSETHVRLVSFFASVAVILLIYRLAAKLFGMSLGLLGALLVAVSLPLARESVRGLRLEAELVLLLVFLEVAFVTRVRTPLLRSATLGLLGGVLALLRANYLIGLAPLLFLSMSSADRRRTLLTAGLGFALMMAITLPHRWSGYQLHGHFFWDQADYATWFANAEFAGRPGWPSKLEMWRDTGAGPSISFFEYFFRLHTVPEFVAGCVRGAWKIVRHMELIAFHRGVARITGMNLAFIDAGFQLVGIIGLGLAAMTRGLRWMPFAFLLLLGHVAFVYDRGLVEPWRHTYHAFPLMVLGALLTMSVLLQARAALREGRSIVPSVPWAKEGGQAGAV